MILLDTHALYWTVSEPRCLSRHATRAIQKASLQNAIAIASVTLFELADLFRRGRIRSRGWMAVAPAVETIVTAARAQVLDITPQIAGAATEFPPDFPHDPMDRLIAATARVNGCALVTKDRRLQDSPLIRTIW